MPLHSGAQTREAMDLVVRDGDRLSKTRRDRSRLALQASPEHADRRVGSLAAGRLPADAVDDHEEPARGVDVEPVLVDLALQPGVGAAGALSARVTVCQSRPAHLRLPCASSAPFGRPVQT